ncbi:hypothetical protein LTR82_005108 [Friedmanniomyces endolithicus]|uniref:Uncharacterized protein n=1 Tax=Friedmanniomyces endolithicus TaxID=329885 RepID=A0AAN6JBQ8_9PEZI|nr:hypothetical protein LTR82_005108 [Friedmanniomyces endolithicus]
MPELEAAETNPLLTLANSTDALTYASTKPFLASQLRDALRTLAREIMQALVDQGRAFLYPDPNALPGHPKDVLWVLGPDPEANDLNNQWSAFASDVDTTMIGFDRPTGACEGMSDNVIRILLVSAWEQRGLVRKSEWRSARNETTAMSEEAYQE